MGYVYEDRFEGRQETETPENLSEEFDNQREAITEITHAIQTGHCVEVALV